MLTDLHEVVELVTTKGGAAVVTGIALAGWWRAERRLDAIQKRMFRLLGSQLAVNARVETVARPSQPT